MKRLPLRTAVLCLLAIITPALHAHLGSPDTFVQAHAGPYTFLLAAHPPAVYPGALELDLRFNPDDHITAATAILDDASPNTIQVLVDGTATTSLFLQTPEAHTIRIAVQGSTYTLNLPPAPAAANPNTPRYVLLAVLIVLIAQAIIGAIFLLRPGRRIVGLGFLAGSFVFLLVLHHLRGQTQTTTITADLTSTGQLTFSLNKSGESFNDLVPDHGRILHLFLIRQPQDDVFLHLHPTRLAPNKFQTQLPAMPPGTYQLFADYYHADGRSETATIPLDLPGQPRTITHTPDDSTAVLPPLSRANDTTTASLPDGYKFQLITDTPLHPLTSHLLNLTLLDPNGQPPSDMALYLGMTAHAVVIRTDAPDPGKQVFAHIHPGGTLPMLMPARADGSMPGMVMPTPSNTATIPYGFPAAGHYRLFVQMKHGQIIETGAFDLTVD